MAIIAQLAPTYGLRRSPILLIFQKNPVTPVRFSLVSPGCNVCSVKIYQMDLVYIYIEINEK